VNFVPDGVDPAKDFARSLLQPFKHSECIDGNLQPSSRWLSLLFPGGRLALLARIQADNELSLQQYIGEYAIGSRAFMGIYNEVCKSCPKCGKFMEIQIPQVIYGFGGFNLDMPDTYAALSSEQKEYLFDLIKEKTFYCVCYHSVKGADLDIIKIRDLQKELVECKSNRANCPDCGVLLQINDDKTLTLIEHR
jgi:hypothetical protein